MSQAATPAKHSVLKWLPALITAFAASQLAKFDDGVEVKPGDFVQLRKGIGATLRKIRIAAGVAESAVATALGMGVDDYVAAENDEVPLSLNAAGIGSLAKVVKKQPAELAAALLSDDPNAGAGTPKGGEQAPAEPAVKAFIEKTGEGQKLEALLKSRQVSIITSDAIEKMQSSNNKPRDLQKAEQQTELVVKGILGIEDPKFNVQKDPITFGMITPGATTLNPSIGTTLLGLMEDRSAFLKSIQTVQMSRTKQEVLVWDIGSRKARRFSSGHLSDRTKFVQGINRSLLLDANKINLVWSIEQDTITQYKNNLPGLEQMVVEGFTTALANELIDIAFNATTDTYNAAAADPAMTLAVGWVKKLQDLVGDANRPVPAAQILNVSAGGAALDTVQEIFDELIKQSLAAANGNKRFFGGSPKPSFIVSPDDWELFERAVMTRTDALTVVFDGAPEKYRRRPVTLVDFLDANTMLYTKLTNLVMGIVNGENEGITIERHVVPQGIDFYATIWADFEFVNPAAACLAKP